MLRIGFGLDSFERDAQRCRKRSRALHSSEREGIEMFQPGAQMLQRFGGLRVMDHPAHPAESDAIARLDRSQQRLPFGLLTRVERIPRVGAIAQRVGFSEAQQSGDCRWRIGCDLIDREIGHVAQHEASRVDLVALLLPFTGERRGERHRGDDLRRAHCRQNRAAIEPDLPSALNL
ncbi:MAG: hypothetical protein A3J40_05740 [Erythrobacter sp. RIFCSPHIGHO2_12_FULL_63_10]|nr:MAG: hypothetical protein A3J40_05740 [Erythrobacter sp. RIFCSPHIGHO2_12_FULL_63_10]